MKTGCCAEFPSGYHMQGWARIQEERTADGKSPRGVAAGGPSQRTAPRRSRRLRSPGYFPAAFFFLPAANFNASPFSWAIFLFASEYFRATRGVFDGMPNVFRYSFGFNW